MSTAATLLTEGSIYKKLIRFALPIFCGDLFQQLYNAVDAIIVGNFDGDTALAAITSTAHLSFMLVGFFAGVFGGFGVVISRYFGAGDRETVKRATGTAVAFGLLAGVGLTVIGVLLTPPLLRLIGTPDNVFELSKAYIQTYFGGIITIVLYNVACGIFRAVGDSRHPLYYLLISSGVNVVLDLLFVAVFGWGVRGAAIATVLAQGTSVVLAFSRLFRLQDLFGLSVQSVRIHTGLLRQMLGIGLPAGIQNSVISIANLVVQASINRFGSPAMAGCGAYGKLEGFAFIPVTSFMLSLTTFVSQNLGAGQIERVKKGARFGVALSCVLSGIIGLIFYALAPQMIRLFGTEDPQTLEIGVQQVRTVTLFYMLLAFSHSCAGVLRGAGLSVIPMATMVFCWCVIRVLYITVIMQILPELQMVFWAYPITWFLSACILAFYLWKVDWLRSARHIPKTE